MSELVDKSFSGIAEASKAAIPFQTKNDDFSQVFELSPIVCVINDLDDKRFVAVNAAFEKASGYSRTEILGKTSLELGLIENKDEFNKFFKTVGENIHFKDYEMKFMTRNGARIGSLSSEFINFNGKKCVLSMIEDITERKNIEELLHKEVSKAKIYLDIVPAMILALDVNGNITLINQKGCDILECPHDDIIGKNWFYTFLPESAWENIRGKFRQLLFGNIEQAEYLENDVLTCKKNIRQVRWHNALLHDDSGKIIGTISAGEDITERKNAEASLKKSEEKFSTAFNSSPAIMSIISLKDKKFLEVNNAWENRTGYFRENIKGRVLADALLSGSNDISKALDSLAASGKVYQTEIKLHLKDSSLLIGLLSAERLEFNGESCALTVLEDITERKKSEETLQERTAELEKFNKLTIGRELKMIELKDKIKELESRLEEAKKHIQNA